MTLWLATVVFLLPDGTRLTPRIHRTSEAECFATLERSAALAKRKGWTMVVGSCKEISQ